MSNPQNPNPSTPIPDDSIGNDAMDFATGNLPGPMSDASWPASPEEQAATALHRSMISIESMPAELTRKLEAMIDSDSSASRSASGSPVVFPFAGVAKQRTMLPWALAAAAGIALAATVLFMQRSVSEREQALADARQKIQALEHRVLENDALLASARSDLSRQTTEVAAVAQRELKLAEQLADATRKYAMLESEHTSAMIKIATLEAPVDPLELQKNRTKLLEVPGTVRLAWSPFNLEGAAPAEQPGIKGDVVWNDKEKAGYLRFEGLKPNDPKVEQYQVWVIDERGMEQKVSGGVFNASANGEIVVPIHPGIDVGRVVLFAITIEKPGGTWVPDLKRRVVIAPRS